MGFGAVFFVSGSVEMDEYRKMYEELDGRMEATEGETQRLAKKSIYYLK